MDAPKKRPVSRQELEDQLRAIICKNWGVNPDQVMGEVSFKNDLGADSLDEVELVMELEDKFGLTIPEEEAEKIQTFSTAINYLTGVLNITG